MTRFRSREILTVSAGHRESIVTGCAAIPRTGDEGCHGLHRLHSKLGGPVAPRHGMIERGYARNFADWTFAQLDGFGSDGFSESHAASFALIASGIGFLAHICLLTAKLHANDIATVIQIQTLNQTTADRYPTIVIAVMLTGFCHKIAAQAELLV